MKHRILRPMAWMVLFSFFFSLNGFQVLAGQPTILDNTEVETTPPAPPSNTFEAGKVGESRTSGGSTGSVVSATGETREGMLCVPTSNATELVLVENYDLYNVPKNELGAVDGRQGPCGPFATASAMKGRGFPITLKDVLAELKPWDCYTTPNEVVHFLLSKGVSAIRKEGSSVKNILNFIRTEKKSVICLIDACDVERKNGVITLTKEYMPHWINIVGVRLKDGEISSVLAKDTYWSQDSGSIMELPADEFDFRWREMRGIYKKFLDTNRLGIFAKGQGTNSFADRLRQYFNPILPGELGAEGIADLASFGGETKMRFAEGLRALVRGNPMVLIAALSNDVTRIGTGLVKVVTGLITILPYQVGLGFNQIGSKMVSDAWKKGGVCKILIAGVIGVPLMVVGKALMISSTALASSVNAAVQMVRDITRATLDAMKTVFDKIMNIESKAVDFAKKGVKKAGEILSDAGNGIKETGKKALGLLGIKL